MTTTPPSARWLVRDLVERARSRSDTPDNDTKVVFEACVRTHRELTRELGKASAEMLVHRARLEVAESCPSILFLPFDEPWELGIVAFNANQGQTPCPDITAGLESVLESLLAIVGRFVGIDIVVRMISDNAKSELHDARGTG